jgi:hypothetical protein
MRHAQRALEDEPWIGLWAQLTVLAHLMGWPTPVPVPTALATLTAHPERTVQCAISHAVEAAAASSLSLSIPRPTALGVHASEVILARAERNQWLCLPDEPEWLLPDPIPIKVAAGLLRPAKTGQTASLPDLLSKFIECRWPLQFLPAEMVPGGGNGDRSADPSPAET